jgi:hypothetical protein
MGVVTTASLEVVGSIMLAEDVILFLAGAGDVNSCLGATSSISSDVDSI